MTESSLAWKVAWATNRKRREQQQKRIAELEGEVERLEAQHEQMLGAYDRQRAEIERLNQALDMLAEQREAWKAKAEQLRKQFAMSDSDEALMLRAEVERLRAQLQTQYDIVDRQNGEIMRLLGPKA